MKQRGGCNVQISKNISSRHEKPLCFRPIGSNTSNTINHKPADTFSGTALVPSRMFSGISPCDHFEICAAARPRCFARAETLYREGDPIQRFLLLTSGLVKVTQLGKSGTEAILRLGASGDFVDPGCLLSSGRHCTTAKAFRLCHALVWDAPTFNALVARYPVLYRNLVQLLGEHLLELEERFREVATERVGPRVAQQLLRLLSKIGRPADGAVLVTISRQELAEMTGTTLFTVSRLLSAWEERGIVKPSREAVTVCDVESLRCVTD